MLPKLEGVCTLIQVFDMPTSVAFYRDTLGFEVVMRSGGEPFSWALLRCGEVELMLNDQHEPHARPGAPDPVRSSAHGDTCLYFGCRDLHGAYEHLKALSLDVKPPVVRPYDMRQLGFKDPDGYEICLQWPEPVASPSPGALTSCS